MERPGPAVGGVEVGVKLRRAVKIVRLADPARYTRAQVDAAVRRAVARDGPRHRASPVGPVALRDAARGRCSMTPTLTLYLLACARDREPTAGWALVDGVVTDGEGSTLAGGGEDAGGGAQP